MTLINPPERKRSPRFPSHSLKEALGYARKMYDAVHRSPIDSSTAVKVMGFSGKSGASASALGSVRQYGLIDGLGDRTRISELGLMLLEPASEEEYASGLKNAAFSPQIFGSISERFSGKIPSVDEPLRSYLIRDLGFSKPGAAECVASLRATLGFLNDSAPDSAKRSEPTLNELLGDAGSQAVVANPTNPADSLKGTGGGTHTRFPLTRDCYAELTLYGEVGPKALENLKRHIQFLVEILGET